MISEVSMQSHNSHMVQLQEYFFVHTCDVLKMRVFNS